MKLHLKELKKGIALGTIAGVVWGLIAIAVNFLTGAFPFENSLIYNIVTFTAGGAIFGIVVGGFMAVTEEILPFKKPILKVVLISASLWTIIRLGGSFLTLSLPLRYHPVTAQNIQGFILAVILGVVLGWLWNKPSGRGSTLEC